MDQGSGVWGSGVPQPEEEEEGEEEEEKGSEAIRGCFALTVVRNLISSSRFNIGENINKRPNIG